MPSGDNSLLLNCSSIFSHNIPFPICLERNQESYLHAGSVLNLDGHLISVHLDLSGVQVSCTGSKGNNKTQQPVSQVWFRSVYG